MRIYINAYETSEHYSGHLDENIRYDVPLASMPVDIDVESDTTNAIRCYDCEGEGSVWEADSYGYEYVCRCRKCQAGLIPTMKHKQIAPIAESLRATFADDIRRYSELTVTYEYTFAGGESE